MNASAVSVAVLGAGSLGECVALGFRKSDWPQDRLRLVARREDRAREAQSVTGYSCGLDPVKAIAGCGVIIVSVKPKDVGALLQIVAPEVTADQAVISFAAGVPIARYEESLPGVPVVRAMPNLPSRVGEGITCYAPGSLVTPAVLARVTDVLGMLGPTLRLEESLLDAVTAVSGTGPAYVFLLAEALTESALREGLPRDVAVQLVHQTLKGAGQLLVETVLGPTELRARVTSPGGTTAAAVHVLEERGFRALLEDAVRAASERSRELGARARPDS